MNTNLSQWLDAVNEQAITEPMLTQFYNAMWRH